MAQRHKPEEIVIKLLQVEVLVSQGSSVADAIRSIEVTQITYYRWGRITRWESGYVESFNARLRDELLNGEKFYLLCEAAITIEIWRRHYNAIRPHASLMRRSCSPASPGDLGPTYAAWPAALTRPAPPAKLPVAQRPTNLHTGPPTGGQS